MSSLVWGFVILGWGFVILGWGFVIPDLIRDPVPRRRWIADRVRNDKVFAAMTKCLPQ
jgi:hypothetical protein